MNVEAGAAYYILRKQESNQIYTKTNEHSTLLVFIGRELAYVVPRTGSNAC